MTTFDFLRSSGYIENECSVRLQQGRQGKGQLVTLGTAKNGVIETPNHTTSYTQ